MSDDEDGMAGRSNALRDITFGSIAGMVSKVFEHPFDLVKVRLQSQPTDRPPSFDGPADCFRQTYVKEGFRGLYRGLSMPVMGAACENATLFLVYNKCQDLIVALRPEPSSEASSSRISDPAGDYQDVSGLSEKAKGKRRQLSTGEKAIAAAAAGAAASFILTPIELIKCRMQVQMLAKEGAFGPNPPISLATSATSTSGPSSLRPRLPRPQGPISLVISTVRTQGLRGLWLGQMGTLFRETGGSSAWFTAYELTSGWFLSRLQRQWYETTRSGTSDVGQPPPPTKSSLPAYQLMLSGATAGISYNVVLFPADSIKSAVQTWSELHPTAPRLGFWAMGRKIWLARGLRGLYAGLGVTCLRSAPSSAMIFWIYETLQGKFGHYFDPI